MSVFTGGWVSPKLIFPLLFWNLSFHFFLFFFFFFLVFVGLKLYNIFQEVLNNAGTEAD